MGFTEAHMWLKYCLLIVQNSYELFMNFKINNSDV